MTQADGAGICTARASSVLDAIGDSLVVVDADGTICYLNAAWRRFDGDAERFRVGGNFARACAAIFEPGEQTTAVARAPNEVANGRCQRLELGCAWLVATGRRFGEITITPCELESGRGALVQLVDVSERTNADAAVRESEARYRSLVDGSPDIVFITDSASRMIYANRALEDQTGYTAADFQMRQPENPFLHPDDAERVAAFIADFVASDRKHSDRIENRFITKRGEALWYSSVISKVQYMGVAALQFVVHNITEQREAEQESARRIREAQEAIRVRDEFLAIAAHELKTPITSLRGYAQWLKKTIASGATPDVAQQTRALDTIDRQSVKLTRLIEQLLDFSRLQSGRMVLERASVNVASIVADAVAGARARSRREIAFVAPQALVAYVDPLRLEQVVTNLLENAIKFSSADTAVEAEVGTDGAGHCVISVRDHGIGVPEQERGRLFERFYQTDPQRGGMGLGLFLSREIVEKHGGRITAEFPPDGGSRFIITLDCAAREPA